METINRTYISLNDLGFDGEDIQTDKSDIYATNVKNLVAKRWQYNWIYYVDNDTEEARNKAYNKWTTKFNAIMDATYNRYSTIIGLYDQYVDDTLMDDLTSDSVTKFNDTPQDSGNFSNDPHTSTVTSTKNTVQSQSKIDKLEDIYEKLHNLYWEWSNEFVGLFGGVADE